MISLHALALALPLALWSHGPAQAQEAEVATDVQDGTAPVVAAAAGLGKTAINDASADQQDNIFDGDYITLGVGALYSPSFQGSDDYAVFPAPAVVGRIEGINFVSRGTGISADLWTNEERRNVDVILGPVARLRFDRTSLGSINDPVIETLGDVDLPLELGISAGVQLSNVLTPVDTIAAAIEVKHDVVGAHNGLIITPNITYFTALSQGVVVSATISGEIVNDDFADTYFSIDAADSLASGLPVYQAEGGLKNITSLLLVGFDLDGNLANGGFALFGAVSYQRILGDTRDSPIISVRGDADQYVGAIGIGYTF
ncbi:MipA/OmpV family protein [Alterisphingorhabdus coralli]|uniref:MipA/OmpV family protein n=1 Tax=Alterisphingorhabdus coralli TaxID=3071408 RepID=A0AA97F9D9_9SPHN|nr:MipA/OmpV family protein [Parasphingorhabdus sp. SCSIO 66989]WOE74890.1 MipA/OmpV family protein [Parasphingorhabdus sp. SCSIO 66989]